MRADTWLDELAHELRSRGVEAGVAAGVVVEAQRHLEEAADAPMAVFGTPASYAERIVDAVEPPAGARRPGVVRLHARGIAKTLGRRTVLRSCDLELRTGEVALLIGPNGSGKSTLLRILAGVDAPDAGSVWRQGRVGYAPQGGGLADRLTPVEHFALFGAARGLARARAARDGLLIAEQLGWDARRAPVAGSLSAGTRQKLSVALAALGEPETVLLDEPCDGLDLAGARRFWDLLWSWRDAGRAALVASHARDALDRADRIVELSAHA
jgi:ABC-2 type transport system ATP-binding protein